MLRITGRDRAKGRGLVAELSDQLDVTIEAAPSIEDGVRFADIICATTHAPQPVVCRQRLRSGTHVNSVGYNTSGDGEIDAATIRDALLVVESRAAVLAVPPAGAVEVHRAIEDGTVTAGHIHAEVGELVSGTTTGRTATSSSPSTSRSASPCKTPRLQPSPFRPPPAVVSARRSPYKGESP
jgi:ornithine cyclodeaminase/alanine dehydrogenase-like protein (mu-crystallin family)